MPQTNGNTGKYHSCIINPLLTFFLFVLSFLDKVVKNIPVFKCLFNTFDYLSSVNNDQINALAPLQGVVFTGMKEIITAHSCNYFLLEFTDALPQFLECMEKYNTQTQLEVLQLLTYVLDTLNFTPLKELAVLSLHFHSM